MIPAEPVPAELDPWLPWLRAQLQAADTLSPWMPLLAAAVGPRAEIWDADPGGAPSGWSGLTNRGTFDRLAISEWLLADEMPDEFLRRAGSGEQLFVELERTRPQRAPWAVVLCDCGPDQLGPPRLVHYALLVVLHLRDPAVRLRSGAIQGSVLWDAPVEREAGVALARSRTRRPPSVADAAAWTKRLAEADPDADPPDLWVVGGEGATQLPFGRANRVSVAEDEVSGALDVVVRRADGSEARVSLPAPEGRPEYVLRDPFAPRRARTTWHAPGTGPVSITYAASDRLYVRRSADDGDRLWVLATPDRVRERPRVLHSDAVVGGQLVAAGRSNREPWSLWTVGDALVLHRGAASSEKPLPDGFARPTPGDAVGPLFAAGGVVVVRDGAGTVWRMAWDRDETEVIGAAAANLACGPRELAWIGGGALWWLPNPTATVIRAHPVSHADGAVRPSGRWMLTADGESVELHSDNGSRRLAYPWDLGSPVAGRMLRDQAVVVGLDAEEVRVWREDVDPIRCVVGEPVVDAWIAPDSPVVAVLTTQQIVFFGLEDGAVYVRWRLP